MAGPLNPPPVEIIDLTGDSDPEPPMAQKRKALSSTSPTNTITSSKRQKPLSGTFRATGPRPTIPLIGSDLNINTQLPSQQHSAVPSQNGNTAASGHNSRSPSGSQLQKGARSQGVNSSNVSSPRRPTPVFRNLQAEYEAEREAKHGRITLDALLGDASPSQSPEKLEQSLAIPSPKSAGTSLFDSIAQLKPLKKIDFGFRSPASKGNVNTGSNNATPSSHTSPGNNGLLRSPKASSHGMRQTSIYDAFNNPDSKPLQATPSAPYRTPTPVVSSDRLAYTHVSPSHQSYHPPPLPGSRSTSETQISGRSVQQSLDASFGKRPLENPQSNRSIQRKSQGGLERNIQRALKAFHHRKLMVDSELRPGPPASPVKRQRVSLGVTEGSPTHRVSTGLGRQTAFKTSTSKSSNAPEREQGVPSKSRAFSFTPTLGGLSNGPSFDTARPRQVQASSSWQRSNFDRSVLSPRRKGQPWSIADEILLVYLKEFHGDAPTGLALDRFIGRSFGGGSSPAEIKYIQNLKPGCPKRQKLNLATTIPALKQILTLDLNATQTMSHLQTFIDMGVLPNGLKVPPPLIEATLPTFTPSMQSGPPIREAAASTSQESWYSPAESIYSDSQRPRRPPTAPAPIATRPRMDMITSGPGVRSLPYSGVDTSRERSSSYGSETRPTYLATNMDIRKIPQEHKRGHTLPYLSSNQRDAIVPALDHIDWQSHPLQGPIHVRFSKSEQESLCRLISELTTKAFLSEVPTGLGHTKIARLLAGVPNGSLKLDRLARLGKSKLKQRTEASIKAFLVDCVAGTVQNTNLQARSEPDRSHESSVAKDLINRSIGGNRRMVRDRVYNTFGPSASYSNMSSDVGTVAFAPNSNVFAAGSMCLVDEDSQQYNNPVNLVIGDAHGLVLQEKADHWRPRGCTAKGANSTEAMYRTQDKRLFETVAMVDFSSDGKYMYSGGYDNKVRAYAAGDATHSIDYIDESTNIELKSTRDMGARVDLLRVSHSGGRIAVGSQSRKGISVLEQNQGRLDVVVEFGTEDDKDLTPSCLQWGPPNLSNLLLAGFLEKGDECKNGKLMLWDVEAQKPISATPSTGQVFDISWAPISPRFAAVMRPNQGKTMNRGINTLIRLFNPFQDGLQEINWRCRKFELDCPAHDINDVVFCPYNENYLAAGATDGRIYVYDCRNPANILHVLGHGPASIDQYSVGVRFCAWNHRRQGLVTGSSDGVVKEWDIFRNSEDAHTADLATLNSGVMSGSFSPDLSRLIIGEVNRTITIFEPGNRGSNLRTLRPFKAIEVPQPEMLRASTRTLNIVTDNGASKVNNPTKCELDLCRKSELPRDFDVSSRWKDRIPANLINALEKANEPKPLNPTIIQATIKCVHCQGPAITAEEDDLDQLLFPRCERCAFHCLRCGDRSKLAIELEKISCECGQWVVGALGYYEVDHQVKKPMKVIPDSMDLDDFESDLGPSEADSDMMDVDSLVKPLSISSHWPPPFHQAKPQTAQPALATNPPLSVTASSLGAVTRCANCDKTQSSKWIGAPGGHGKVCNVCYQKKHSKGVWPSPGFLNPGATAQSSFASTAVASTAESSQTAQNPASEEVSFNPDTSESPAIERFTIEDMDDYGLEDFYLAMGSLKINEWHQGASSWEAKEYALTWNKSLNRWETKEIEHKG
ncbi:WD40 repeat-like protein [Microthyrium microscopicum]|uniref:WD40 repeat-like protein n=1 Tax=Microthyrium microscopicum TaxID=703497 RepID=A0A6A6UJQ3_9PEZI|nr:WD40 repeat-like protein [Microthyrium microscopicum]